MQSVRNEQAEQYERRDSFINYSAKAQRKRRRLSRIVLDGTPVSAGKRRSSVSDAGKLFKINSRSQFASFDDLFRHSFGEFYRLHGQSRRQERQRQERRNHSSQEILDATQSLHGLLSH